MTDEILQVRLQPATLRDMVTKRKRDKRKKKYGIRSAQYSSQKLPQIPKTLFGPAQSWIRDSIDRYRVDFYAKHRVPLETPKVVRQALSEMITQRGWEPLQKAPGDPWYLGPFRLANGSEDLLDRIRDYAESKGINDADVIRGALASWLIGKGYGQKRRGK